MSHSGSLILVTGATGMQGGATARSLLAHGHRVRILTRNPDSPAARVLVRMGAEAVRGDMSDRASLDGALRGVSGVFSMQSLDGSGSDAERQHGFALVLSALQSGVQQVVHTSVAATARHTQFRRWGTGYWWEKYWTDKWDIEEAVRNAGFGSWTVLRPAFMMGNFSRPKSDFMFPHLRHGEIATALKAETRLDLVSADDIGSFARAAFENPELFNRRNIDIAAESLTLGEVAATLSRVCGKAVKAVELSPAEAVARGLFAGWVNTQEWLNEVGYQVDIGALKSCGVPLTTLEQWANRHRAEIFID
jgi:uncharacterized protein YbjT (DUF2867 family)